MKPIKVNLGETPKESVGDFARQLLFAPGVTGNRNLRFGVTTMKPGAVSAPHTHPGEEISFALSGEAVITVEGVDYALKKHDAFLVPPGVVHPVRVVGEEPYVVLSVYCDDCPLLAGRIMQEAAPSEKGGGE